MTDELRQALETERVEIENTIHTLHEERRQIVRRLNAIYELLASNPGEQKEVKEPSNV